ncbi:PH domain-like protein [Patellaria atrata CBS 101060]|uniref:PH domain-like protein n=1 Tax=Patellaria atrata CBS 101060 TaxID=1346257 RepID=A0A9P4VQ96_9PEZI|nr:PH domain-like protein [Patellaria atrata CBS 101060]
MSTRKSRPRNQTPHNLPPPQQQQQQILASDYETDALPPAPPPRTNAELNLAVLQRHNDTVTSILSIAPYAVIYVFSPTSQQWEKHGIEGTLFVCSQTPGPLGEDRFCVIILNRRGLENFVLGLERKEDVEITAEYVILQMREGDAGNGSEGTHVKIFGIWIFSEPAPSSTERTREINAKVIQDCAAHAENSRMVIERAIAHNSNGNGTGNAAIEESESEATGSVPMGRHVSLRDLFERERKEDSSWSIHNHHSADTMFRPLHSQAHGYYRADSATIPQQSQPRIHHSATVSPNPSQQKTHPPPYSPETVTQPSHSQSSPYSSDVPTRLSHSQPRFVNTPDTDFFRSTSGLGPGNPPKPTPSIQQPAQRQQPVNLQALFKKDTQQRNQQQQSANLLDLFKTGAQQTSQQQQSTNLLNLFKTGQQQTGQQQQQPVNLEDLFRRARLEREDGLSS